MATVKQMLARMHAGHFQALERVSQGLPMFAHGSRVTAGDYRGARKVSGTLCAWGVVKDGALTEAGRELLVAARIKFSTPASPPRTSKLRVSAFKAPPDDYEWNF